MDNLFGWWTSHVDWWSILFNWLISTTAFQWFLSKWEAVTAFVFAAGWAWRFERSFSKVQDIHKSAFYNELDNAYFRLMKLAIDMPHLRQPELLNNDADALKTNYEPYPATKETPEVADKRARYDSYAFMVWNFLETIHDRCEEYPELLGTWGTIVSAEDQIHRGWFLKQMREASRHGRKCDKFRHEFQIFVHDNNFKEVGEGKYPNWSYNHKWWCYEWPKKFKVQPEFA